MVMHPDRIVPGIGVAAGALIWVEGPDTIMFVDGQVSQDVGAMSPGGVQRSFLLEPRGKLRAILWVLRGVDAVGLVTPPDTAAAVVADLERFRFRVRTALRIDPRPVHTVWGQPAAMPGWSDDGVALHAAIPSRVPHRVVAAMEPPDGAILDRAALAANRIAAGEPQFGVDVDETTIPQETGLVPEAVSFTKGCYLGQELVARIDTRGHVNRSLRRIRGVGEPPPPGAAVTASGTAVGTLGTVAPLPQGWMALGVLRREAGPGTGVAVRWEDGEAAATVEEIGLDGAPSHPSNRSEG
jgi:folate-binding protein YgfZ